MRLPPLAADPLGELHEYAFAHHPWAAEWIGPDTPESPAAGVWMFCNRFDVPAPQTVRLHVSADQRYVLFLDGERIGRGPERGDMLHWMYDSYSLDVAAGAHVLAALVTWQDPAGDTPPPLAQVTHRPGLMVFCEEIADLSTSHERWRIKPLPAYRFSKASPFYSYFAVGSRIDLDAAAHDWGAVAGEGADWRQPTKLMPVALAASVHQSLPQWLLRPAMLPAMRDDPHTDFAVRHVDTPASADTQAAPIRAAEHRAREADAWTAMLHGTAGVTLPPHTRRRVVIDLKRYVCAYTTLHVEGGAGGRVRLLWSEALHLFDPAKEKSLLDVRRKDNRNDIEGKHFLGYGDTIRCDGRARTFEPLWWGAGRYLELFVETADEPLTIHDLRVQNTGYPYAFVNTFAASDERLAKVVPLALHTLKMCSHETSMDCPYYEQLNYAGDTRLQSLVAMTSSADDRLARKNLNLFDWSRTGDGWPSSRYPTAWLQTIPPFGLWWAASVCDYAMYRGDRAFVQSLMPGVRATLDRWRQQIDDDGLVRTPRGWNFVDWVTQWNKGVPTPKFDTPCGVLQWQLCHVLGLAAELEDAMNEPLLAQRNRNTAAMLAAVGERVFYDPSRGLLADDVGRTQFSEHAQVLALLCGPLSKSLRGPLVDALSRHTAEESGALPRRGRDGAVVDLARTSIYFSHYTFEALAAAGRVGALIERLRPWFDHETLGLSTTLEQDEPSRSDCHAWGAHPVFHFHAGILGVRPAAFGYAKVRVAPQLGPLAWAEGTCPHPRGTVAARFERDGDRLRGFVTLPDGVDGTLHANGGEQPLGPGRNPVN